MDGRGVSTPNFPLSFEPGLSNSPQISFNPLNQPSGILSCPISHLLHCPELGHPTSAPTGGGQGQKPLPNNENMMIPAVLIDPPTHSGIEDRDQDLYGTSRGN